MCSRFVSYVRGFSGVSGEHVIYPVVEFKIVLQDILNCTHNYHLKPSPVNPRLRYFSSDIRQSSNSDVADSVQISSQIGESSKVKLLLSDFMKFVEKLVHMDEMIAAQSKVMEIKDALIADRSQKTDVIFELNRIREQLKRCQDYMHNAPRGSEQHVALLREETRLMDEERSKQLEFSKADELERENFAKLAIAINNSYQKEQVYSHTLKNLGIVCTLVGSLISFVGASIGFYLHNKKSGLLVQNLKETVNEIITREVGMLKEELHETLRELSTELKRQQLQTTESWGGYLKRHTVRAYRWIWPARKE